MKVAVSLPDELFDDAETAAERWGLNRSQLYARALAEYLAARSIDEVTVRLNELADEMPVHDGPAAGRRLIDAGAWEW